MFSMFKPTWMLEAVYLITPEQLKKIGVKAVLTDLDNTLIAWNDPDGSAELINWIKQMKEAEIPVVVISNNKESRIERVVSRLGLTFISRAMKPFKRGFKKAEKELGLSKEELLMVGDQLLTDIRGANGAGIRTVLVKPIVETDAWNTRINRWLERFVKNYLVKQYPEMKWRQNLL